MDENMVAPRTLLKAFVSEITTTSVTKSHTIVLPTLYTPLNKKTSSTDYIDQENHETFTINIHSPLPTQTQTTSTTKIVKYGSNEILPSIFQPLSSKASQELTQSSLSSNTITIATSNSVATSTLITNTQSLDAARSHHLSGNKLAGIIVGSVLGGSLLIYMLYVLCWSRWKILNKRESKGDGRDHTETISNISNEEKYFYEEHQSIHLPRQRRDYNPNRMYSYTNHHPRNDFIGYYNPPSY